MAWRLVIDIKQQSIESLIQYHVRFQPIWKEYDAYENSLNKLLAKSLLTELR